MIESPGHSLHSNERFAPKANVFSPIRPVYLFHLFPSSPLGRTLAALAAVTLVSGCTTLTPYSQIKSSPLGEHLLTVQGQKVYVETAGSGEAVVLIHGFGGSTYSWKETMPTLAEHYRVVALDLFGFGFTERPQRLQRYSREGQTELILGVMDKLGIDRAHLVGHSYGGGLVTALALRHPERVHSLVLVDSTNPNYARARRKNFAEIQPLTWAFVRGLALRQDTVRKALERAWYDDSKITDELVDAYLRRLGVEGAARAYRGLTVPFNALDENEALYFYDLQVPVLVVWGEQDELIKVEEGRVAADEIDRARFVSLDDCGHSPMEEKPQEFLRQVLPFLAGPAAFLSSVSSP